MSVLLALSADTARAGDVDAQPYLTQDIAPMSEEEGTETVRALEEKSRHLYEILRAAYIDNPSLNAARAKLKAVEEKLPQALSNYQPTVTADGDITVSDTDTQGGNGFSADGTVTTKSAGVTLSQPLFRGGRTIAETEGAKSLIEAQKASLEATEQSVMLSTITAYMDVLRDRALLNVALNNSEVLIRQLVMAQDRFDVGEITKTDVAQAQARAAQAESDIALAQANLRASIATYEQVTGTIPEETLLYPEVTFVPPESLESALTIAQEKNPAILSAEGINRAAQSDVDEIFGELLPTISLSGNVSRAYDPSTAIDRQDNRSAGVSISVPLYESGSVRSRVREAKHTASQRMMEILETRRSVKQQTIAAWERLTAARAQILARQKEVEAADYVRTSLQDQADVGERTVTDALDAIQDYEEAAAALISARRDEIVSLFTLAQALGALTPETLGFTEDKSPPL